MFTGSVSEVECATLHTRTRTRNKDAEINGLDNLINLTNNTNKTAHLLKMRSDSCADKFNLATKAETARSDAIIKVSFISQLQFQQILQVTSFPLGNAIHSSTAAQTTIFITALLSYAALVLAR